MTERIPLPIAEATGYSENYSFDEAFREAVDRLPLPPLPYPDQLVRTRVVATGSERGGIAGVDRLYVRVWQLPDPVADASALSLHGGDVPFPFGSLLPRAFGGDVPFPFGWTAGGGEPFPLGAAAGREADRVYRVDIVGVDVLESYPPQYAIRACGQVASSGWSNGRLRPIPTKRPPEDGIYDFEFVATPPSGIVLWVISPIATRPLVWQPDGPGPVHGVRVIAASNERVAPVDGEEGRVERVRVGAYEDGRPED